MCGDVLQYVAVCCNALPRVTLFCVLDIINQHRPVDVFLHDAICVFVDVFRVCHQFDAHPTRRGAGLQNVTAITEPIYKSTIFIKLVNYLYKTQCISQLYCQI